MNLITATSHYSKRLPRQTIIDVVVGAAMALVAIALSLALSLHFGLPMSRSVIAGVMIFGLLIGGHFMIVPREPAEPEISELDDEELWRTLKEQRRVAPDADRIAMATRTPVVAEPSPETVVMEAAEAHIPRRKARIVSADVAEGVAPVSSDPLDQVPANVDAHLADSMLADAEAVDGDETHQSSDYWSYRPRDGALATDTSTASHHDLQPTLSDPAEPHLAHDDRANDELGGREAPARDSETDHATSPRESDVELVQSMIKKLAHQVNATEILKQSTTRGHAVADTVPDDHGHAPVDHDQIDRASLTSLEPESESAFANGPMPATPPPVPLEDAPHHSIEPQQDQPRAGHPAPPSAPAQIDLVGASVEALRTTADALREAEAAQPEGAPDVRQPLRPAQHPEGASRAQAVMAPLAAGQYGVMLEPILSLDGLQPHHYEVQLKLNTSAQTQLESKTLETDLQATGALAAIDQQRFAKAFSVGELLQARGKATDVVTRMHRESLLDRDFCYGVATSGVANESVAHHMVLSLSQDAVRTLTASEWQTLSEFREIGYRFAMCEINDIDMDFSQLTAVGFVFVKLDAQLFLNGGSAADPTLAPQELARYFVGVGLDVILEGVDNAALAGQLAKTGAQLVQGPISGGPRLMRAEVVQGASNAVA